MATLDPSHVRIGGALLNVMVTATRRGGPVATTVTNDARTYRTARRICEDHEILETAVGERLRDSSRARGVCAADRSVAYTLLHYPGIVSLVAPIEDPGSR